MKRSLKSLVFVPFLLAAFFLQVLPKVEAAGQDAVLKAADITPKIFPERVFFRGQAAPAQLRNTGGVHLPTTFMFSLAWLTAPAIPLPSGKNTRATCSTRSRWKLAVKP